MTRRNQARSSRLGLSLKACHACWGSGSMTADSTGVRQTKRRQTPILVLSMVCGRHAIADAKVSSPQIDHKCVGALLAVASSSLVGRPVSHLVWACHLLPQRQGYQFSCRMQVVSTFRLLANLGNLAPPNTSRKPAAYNLADIPAWACGACEENRGTSHSPSGKLFSLCHRRQIMKIGRRGEPGRQSEYTI